MLRNGDRRGIRRDLGRLVGDKGQSAVGKDHGEDTANGQTVKVDAGYYGRLGRMAGVAGILSNEPIGPCAPCCAQIVKGVLAPQRELGRHRALGACGLPLTEEFTD